MIGRSRPAFFFIAHHSNFAALYNYLSVMFMKLKNIGFSSEIESTLDQDKLNQFEIARVIAVHREQYRISDGERELKAELTGRLQYGIESSLDYPAVGDWVYVQFIDDSDFAVIHDLVPRQSLLKRKTAGKQVEYQAIAANLDFAFIIQAAESDFSINRLERYLVMVRATRIQPVLILSKSDLLSGESIDDLIRQVNANEPDLPVIALSNQDGTGFEKIRQYLNSSQTVCMIGSSGVGKTTLLNRLLGTEDFITAAVRTSDGRGRHTTTNRQLIRLPEGALIIDTPGMRELGNFGAGEGISATYADIFEFADECRFRDCTHQHEQGCAVLAAIASGQLTQQRLDNYRKLERESAHYERSYLEKRNRDKEFGKMVKGVLKGDKRR